MRRGRATGYEKLLELWAAFSSQGVSYRDIEKKTHAGGPPYREMATSLARYSCLA